MTIKNEDLNLLIQIENFLGANFPRGSDGQDLAWKLCSLNEKLIIQRKMNKEQQIKQMMLDVPQNIVAYDGNPAGQHLYGEQRHQIAEALYSAGYRKIQDTSTNVLTMLVEKK